MFNAIILAMMMTTVLLIGSSRIALSTSLDFERFQWKNRLLFLFAPKHDHPFFETLQKALEAQKAEAKDRDLVIFEILETGRSSMDTNVLDHRTAQSLREKFDVPRGEFAVILIGKDGEIKLNRQDQTQLEDIFALIDGMPMRQEEMRQKGRSCSGATPPEKSGGIE